MLLPPPTLPPPLPPLCSYGFCVYDDPRVTDVACAGLNGMRMGDRTLTVRRATEGQKQAPGDAAALQAQMAAFVTVAPPRVVKLAGAVQVEELGNDEEYADILEDMREECSKFGAVLTVHIPRPPAEGAPPPPGLGKVIVEFSEPPAAMAACGALHGRKFGGSVVTAVMMSQDDYANNRWD